MNKPHIRFGSAIARKRQLARVAAESELRVSIRCFAVELIKVTDGDTQPAYAVHGTTQEWARRLADAFDEAGE